MERPAKSYAIESNFSTTNHAIAVFYPPCKCATNVWPGTEPPAQVKYSASSMRYPNSADNAAVHRAMHMDDNATVAVSGIVHFWQLRPTTSGVLIQAKFEGLTPFSQQGIHIHQYGDISNGCENTGAHLNPTRQQHGDPFDPAQRRHAGDLPNLITDRYGNCIYQYINPMLRIEGAYGILGRSLVIHETTDDYGRGPYDDSQTSGHSGHRVACAVIGVAKPYAPM